jgi:hypothetical protein
MVLNTLVNFPLNALPIEWQISSIQLYIDIWISQKETESLLSTVQPETYHDKSL